MLRIHHQLSSELIILIIHREWALLVTVFGFYFDAWYTRANNTSPLNPIVLDLDRGLLIYLFIKLYLKAKFDIDTEAKRLFRRCG